MQLQFLLTSDGRPWLPAVGKQRPQAYWTLFDVAIGNESSTRGWLRGTPNRRRAAGKPWHRLVKSCPRFLHYGPPYLNLDTRSACSRMTLALSLISVPVGSPLYNILGFDQ
jgi:hypothetical protein